MEAYFLPSDYFPGLINLKAPCSPCAYLLLMSFIGYTRNKSTTIILFKKCFLDYHLPVIYYFFLSGYLVHPFCWETYLEWTSSSAAPEPLFNLVRQLYNNFG